MKTKIVVKNLVKIFGDKERQALKMLKEGKSKEEILKKTASTVGVRELSFEVNKNEIFVVMGLSGSGKSTLLRCFNRLIRPSSGEIHLNGKDILKLSRDELRKIRSTKMSMVFQNFGLLPHRTVLSNVAFGLEIQGIKKEERIKKAKEVIATVGLTEYSNQMTDQLSGGMQQRVGIARALANDPDILLMDESFSALDPLIRNNMQDELLDLQEKLHKTIIFITHDLDEALKLGDRIAIMKDGEIVQIGTPEEILSEPANDYVESFVENVSRGDIITASTLMFTNVKTVRLHKHGPSYALRIMREDGLTYMPVLDHEHKFLGFVKDEDVAKLKKENIKSVESAIMEDSPVVGDSHLAKNILALFLRTLTPVAVIDENRKIC